jgi:formylglycine-generating enzyme required for sulfatase activity
LFYAQHDFLAQFQTAMENREGRWPLDTPAKRPLNPDGNSSHRTNHALYDDACDYAEKLLFSQAEELFRALVRRDDPDYAPVAHQWLELLVRYAELIEVHERRNARFLFKSKWDAYQALFPKPFLDGVFDPKGLGSAVVPPPPEPPVQAALQRARDLAQIGKRNRYWKPFTTTFSDLKIPDMPFCLVPTGTFQMGEGQEAHPQTFTEPFYIAQYPVTNAQWRVAVEAGVVGESPKDSRAKQWYDDPKMANAPVVGISWFEAQKFVQWMGCRLPTEREWEYAARGVESWVYPWGDDWPADSARGVEIWLYPWGNDWDADKAIHKYNSEGRPWDVTSKPDGASWVGAWHLSGNVWEWTASLESDYPYLADGSCEVDVGNRTNVQRVLRGGSWFSLQDYLHAAMRNFDTPDHCDGLYGFRCARSPERSEG